MSPSCSAEQLTFGDVYPNLFRELRATKVKLQKVETEVKMTLDNYYSDYYNYYSQNPTKLESPGGGDGVRSEKHVGKLQSSARGRLLVANGLPVEDSWSPPGRATSIIIITDVYFMCRAQPVEDS